MTNDWTKLDQASVNASYDELMKDAISLDPVPQEPKKEDPSEPDIVVPPVPGVPAPQPRLAPTVDARDLAQYVFGGGALFQSVGIADQDGTILSSARVTLDFAAPTDFLSVEGILPSGLTARWDLQTRSLVIEGEATHADYERALMAVRFGSSLATPLAFSRQLLLTVTDATGETSQADAVSLRVVLPPEAPRPAHIAIATDNSFTLGQNAATPLFDSVVLTQGSRALMDAIVHIRNASDGDRLVYEAAADGIQAHWNATTKTLTLSGANSAEAFQAALMRVSFVSEGASFRAGARDIHVAVRDVALDRAEASVAFEANDVRPELSIAADDYYIGAGQSPLIDSVEIVQPGRGIVSATITLQDGAPLDRLTFLAGEDGIVGAWDFASRSLVLRGAASAEAYEAAIKRVSLESVYPDASRRALRVTVVNDGQASASADVSVLARHSTVATLAGLAAVHPHYVEGDGPTRVFNTDFTLTASHDGFMAGMTIAIAGNYRAGDRFTWTLPQGSPLNVRFTDGVLEVRGFARAEDYAEFLRSLHFVSDHAEGRVLAKDLRISLIGSAGVVTDQDEIRFLSHPLHAVFTGTDKSDVLWAGRGNDTVYGLDGNDELRGFAGQDVVYGGAGNDTLRGGTGDDSLYGGHDQDELNGGDGADWLEGGDGDDTLYGGRDNDTLMGGKGHDCIDTGAGTDRAYGGDGNDTILVALVASALSMGAAYGGEGHDMILSGLGNDLLSGDEGNDWLYASEGQDMLYGGAGDDTLDGAAGNDILYGGEGNDQLIGGVGSDDLYGGAGDDTLRAGTGPGALVGGLGRDLIIAANIANQEIYGDLETPLQDFEANNDTIVGGQLGNRIFAGSGADHVTGGESADLINGEFGNDSLLGGAGNDSLYGGQGNDFIDGGEGDDFIYDDLGNNEIRADRGRDVVRVGFGNNLVFGGIGNDSLYGGAYDDTLHGEADQDFIVGGGGADQIFGGAGNDMIFAGALSSSHTPTSMARGLSQAAAFAAFLYGGEGEDTLYGSAGADLISGDDDRDFLFGGGGEDTIFGGLGNDEIRLGTGTGLAHGGLGEDLLYGGTGVSTLLGGVGRDILYGGDAGNLLYGDERQPNFISSVNSADVIYGGRAADTVYGGFGNDLIYGGDGADLLEGGANDDIIYGGQGQDIIHGDQGDDLIFGGLGFNIIYGGDGSDTIWMGMTAFGVVQGGQAYGGHNFDLIYGTSGNDTIDGGDDSDQLYGGAGHDVIYGGAGSDELYGGSGNDTIYGGAGSNRIHADHGDDLVILSSGNLFPRPDNDGIYDYARTYGGAGRDTFVIEGRTIGKLEISDYSGDEMIVIRDIARHEANMFFNVGYGSLDIEFRGQDGEWASIRVVLPFLNFGANVVFENW